MGQAGTPMGIKSANMGIRIKEEANGGRDPS
jgi:hypothetical protein